MLRGEGIRQLKNKRIEEAIDNDSGVRDLPIGRTPIYILYKLTITIFYLIYFFNYIYLLTGPVFIVNTSMFISSIKHYVSLQQFFACAIKEDVSNLSEMT